MTSLARRALLTAGTSVLLAGACETECAFAAEASAALTPSPPTRGELWLKRINGQEIRSAYRNAQGYDRTQIMLLSWFMRDIVDNDHAVWIEPRLFDLLAGVQTALSRVNGSALPLILTSGYRTPAHNAQIESAARNSMHLYGYAADLKVAGYSPRAIALAASFYASGGIGLYDGFTHLDVWRVRTWQGPSKIQTPSSKSVESRSG